MEREYNQNLAKIQQQMNQREQEHLLALQNKQETLNAMVEAKKLADDMAAENQRLLQAEKIKNRQDPFLPSSSAANAATCTQRFTKNKSPPKQKEHPLHRGLAQCQLHLPATNAVLAANPPLAPLSGGFRPAPSKIPKTEVLRRINGAEGGEMDWSGIDFDTWVRLRQMDVDAMRAARPAKPFSSGSPLDYALHIANFERVTNKPTASSKDKIKELVYWFSEVTQTRTSPLQSLSWNGCTKDRRILSLPSSKAFSEAIPSNRTTTTATSSYMRH